MSKIVYSTIDLYPTIGTVKIFDTSIFLKRTPKRSRSVKKKDKSR